MTPVPTCEQPAGPTAELLPSPQGLPVIHVKALCFWRPSASARAHAAAAALCCQMPAHPCRTPDQGLNDLQEWQRAL